MPRTDLGIPEATVGTDQQKQNPRSNIRAVYDRHFDFFKTAWTQPLYRSDVQTVPGRSSFFPFTEMAFFGMGRTFYQYFFYKSIRLLTFSLGHWNISTCRS